MRVLLVDDDAKGRQAMKRFLGGFGAPEILEADNGAEALCVLHDHPVDVIVSDLQMPQLDGLGLVSALRGSGDATPVIVVSGHEDPEALMAAVRAGANGCLPKPFNTDLLLEQIEQATGLPLRAVA